MTTPFVCLFLVSVLPYAWVPLTAPGRKALPGGFDNQNPRAQQAQLTGRAAWAMGAHQNAWEALAVFAPAVIAAHLAGADPGWSARLSVAFVALRVAHGVAYVTGQDKARSGAFTLALLAVVGLWVLAFMA